MSRNVKLLSVCALLSVIPSMAEAGTKVGDVELSANVGFVSEYSFRGLAQSNEEPALQGGFDVSHDLGLYAGIWGSNVEFGDASLETDLYAGYSNQLGKFNYDLGVIYYAYPGTDSDENFDFYELSAAFGYDFDVFSTALSFNYSPDFFAGSGDALYSMVSVDVPLPYDFSLTSHVGYQAIDDNAAFGVKDYTDWAVGVDYSWSGFDFSLSYVDTNLEEPSECADGCDAKVIFGVSRSF